MSIMATAYRDQEAGLLLRELREARGISPEEMPREMLRAGVPRRNIPSGKTIRRIEEGMVPQVRFRFGLAMFFDRSVADVWALVEAAA